MDEHTSTALEASIAHWNANIAAEKPLEAHTGAASCALCLAFNHGDDECAGCPVRAKTGLRHCDRTPYLSAAGARDYWFWNPYDAAARARWQDRATAMRDFLVALREVKT